MTINEFNKNCYCPGDIAIYKEEFYDVAAVDLEEKLFGLLLEISGSDPKEISWVRCENVEMSMSRKLN